MQAQTAPGAWRTAQLLREGTRHRDERVRLPACATLSQHYWGLDECWDTVRSEDVELAAEATEGVACSRQGHRARREQTRNAARWWQQRADTAPRRRWDEARLLALSKYPDVRARFQRLVRAVERGLALP